MKAYLRKQIVDALYQYSSNKATKLTERAVIDTWNVDYIKNIIRNASIDQLHGAGVTFVLVTNWCTAGADMLIKLDSLSFNVGDRTSYYREGQKQLKYATENRNIDLFFDWYEETVLRPLGFTDNEIGHLYEAIELCCMRLCYDMRGIIIHQEFSRPNMFCKGHLDIYDEELLQELGSEIAECQRIEREIAEKRDEYADREEEAINYHINYR